MGQILDKSWGTRIGNQHPNVKKNPQAVSIEWSWSFSWWVFDTVMMKYENLLVRWGPNFEGHFTSHMWSECFSNVKKVTFMTSSWSPGNPLCHKCLRETHLCLGILSSTSLLGRETRELRPHVILLAEFYCSAFMTTGTSFITKFN